MTIGISKLALDFSIHHEGCEICLKAARGRFAGMAPELINKKRCEVGRQLLGLWQEELEDAKTKEN